MKKFKSPIDFLNEAKYIDDIINYKLEQISSLNSLATKATQTFSDMPHSPNRNNSSYENVLIKIMDLQSEINVDVDRLVDLKAAITKAIEILPNITARAIFTKRYLCYETWEDIAYELHFSEAYVYRMHREYLPQIKVPVEYQK